MIRKIITIDEEKCNGCGLCINACHEGALQIIDGKAKLVSDSYCDGLGNCLPECPTNAITIQEREAVPFDEEAVKLHLERNILKKRTVPSDKNVSSERTVPGFVPEFSGCPGSRARTISRTVASGANAARINTEPATQMDSQLGQWPCQIKLVPVHAPYFDNANLLIAADCTAFAYANIHQDFMKNKITIIGCPKLDDVDYSDKLTHILENHNIKSITVLRMEVPCCGGISNAVKNALINSGKMIPWNIVTISTDGKILDI